MRNEDAAKLTAAARRDGMRNLREDGWLKVRRGITTSEEVTRVDSGILMMSCLPLANARGSETMILLLALILNRDREGAFGGRDRRPF